MSSHQQAIEQMEQGGSSARRQRSSSSDCDCSGDCDEGCVYATLWVLGTIFFFFAGIILLIVGVVRLNQDAKIDVDSINRYNELTSNWESGSEPSTIQSRWGSAGVNVYQFSSSMRSNFTVRTSLVTPIVSATAEEATARNSSSTYATALLEEYAFNTEVITFTADGATSFFPSSWTRTVPAVKRFSVPIVCKPALCDKKDDGTCETRAARGGSVECQLFDSQNAACLALSPNATYTAGPDSADCTEDRTCGTCDYIGFLSRACFPFDISSTGTTTLSEDKFSCRYPFSAEHQDYSGIIPPGWLTSPNNRSTGGAGITIELRSVNDPEIVLEELTQGRRDFVLEESGERKGRALIIAGGICLAIAAIGIAGILLVVFCIAGIDKCCDTCCSSSDRESATATRSDQQENEPRTPVGTWVQPTSQGSPAVPVATVAEEDEISVVPVSSSTAPPPPSQEGATSSTPPPPGPSSAISQSESSHNSTWGGGKSAPDTSGWGTNHHHHHRPSTGGGVSGSSGFGNSGLGTLGSHQHWTSPKQGTTQAAVSGGFGSAGGSHLSSSSNNNNATIPPTNSSILGAAGVGSSREGALPPSNRNHDATHLNRVDTDDLNF